MNERGTGDSHGTCVADSAGTAVSLPSRARGGEMSTGVESRIRVSIVVFSPSGNTLRVGSMLEERLSIKGADVQLVDMTRDATLFGDRDVSRFALENVRSHDVLCIGGPVYAHHMHYNVLDLIKALPRPGGDWGRYAVPFATYGTVSSGVALEEAANLLRRTGRRPVFAMKLDAYHSYSRIFPTDVNVRMPGDEAIPLVEDLGGRIAGLEARRGAEPSDVTRELRYLSFADRAKAKTLIRERFWQRHVYPGLRFDPDKCVQCGMCAEVCPVLRIEMTEAGLRIRKGSPQCIHCGSCIAVCPSDAITFKTNMKRWASLFRRAVSGRCVLASNESPKSAVYPLLRC